MQPSRRDFLKTASALAGGLTVAGGLQASAGNQLDKAASELREQLLKRRQAIESLQVDYTYSSSNENDLLNGKNRFYLSRNRYNLRHDGPQGVIVQILNGEQGLDAVVDGGGTVIQVRHWNRSERRSIPRPLDNFLPQLEDKPMTSRGIRKVDGEPCQGLLQGDRLFWVSTKENAVRSVEFFRSADKLGERMLFADFTEPAAGILFPRSVTILDLDDNGAAAVTKVLSVESVTINGPLPEALFAVNQFPGKGERLAP